MNTYAHRLLAAASKEFAGYQRSPTASTPAADLSTGEIRLSSPHWLADALLSGTRQASLGYVDPQGIVGLRKAYTHFLGTQGYAIDEKQVLVTAGAKEALWTALIANCGEGTPLLLPKPGWTPYFMWAKALGTPVHFYDPRDDELVGRLEEIFRQAPSSVLILNSPHNPTGGEISREDFDSIVELAKQYQITILSDEVYRYFARGNPAGSVLGHIQAGERHLIFVDSLSKMLGLAGLRIGFLIADLTTVKDLEVVRSSFGSCVSSVTQSIAQALLSHSQCRQWMEQIALASRDALSTVEAHLSRHGYEIESSGALYLWVKERGWVPPGQCTDQLQLGGAPMKVAPGHLFSCPGYFRLCPIREQTILESVLPDTEAD